jgi:hypothetical protein
VGNVIKDNKLHDNGGFGNPSNGDLGTEQAVSNPRNCFSGNSDPAGLTSDPPNIETVDGPPCNQPGVGDSAVLLAQLACDSGALGQCPAGTSYPQPTTVTLMPVPHERSMANPCAGAPDSAWCTAGQPAGPAATVPTSQLVVLLPLIGIAGAMAAVGMRRRRTAQSFA